MKVKKIILSFTIACFLFSCDNSESSLDQNQSSITNDSPVIKKLIASGYKIEDIQETKEFYVVQGDILFSKNINDYKKSSLTNRHASTYNTVSEQNRVITVGIDSSIPRTGKNDWRSAIVSAMSKWSDLSNTSIKFVLSYDPNPDILIKSDNNTLGASTIAAAGFPFINGKPFNQILINFDFNNNTTVSESSKTYNMVHEFGHCIGFRHTNWDAINEPVVDESGIGPGAIYIPNTPSQDSNSVMNGQTASYSWNGFSTYDIVAVNYLYPTLACNSRLSGPGEGTCAFDRYNDPIRYNVYMIGTKQTITETGSTTWQISGNSLEIVYTSSSACEVRVKANNTSWPAFGTVTRTSGAGCTTTYYVLLYNCINYSYSD